MKGGILIKSIRLWSKRWLTFLIILVAFLNPYTSNKSFAEEATSKTFTFTESQNQTQSQSITINDLGSIQSVEVNTGNVSYSKRNGRFIDLTLYNGSISRQQYNPYKYSKYATDYQTSSYQYGFSYSIPYNDGSYSGTLYQSGSPSWISGTYIPADSMYVSGQTSSYYNYNGYYGSLSPYLEGDYQPPSSYTAYDSCANTETVHYNGTGSSYGNSDYSLGSANGCPSSKYFSSGGYSGTLYGGSASVDNYCPTSGGPKWGTCVRTWTKTYSGTVTNPGYDYRVTRYQGWVYRDEVDTRIWRQDYSGTVYQSGYDNYYQYKVTVKYVKDTTPPTLDLIYNDDNLSHQVVVTVKSTDTESGVKQITLPNGSTVSSGSTSYTVTKNGDYTFKSEDWAGNETTKTITIRNIDNDNPNAPTIVANEEWSKYDQNATISHNGDIGVAGVDRIEYSLSGITSKGWTTYTSPLTISTEGKTTITARVIDKAGNISKTTSKEVKIDKSNPVLTVTPDIYGLTNTDIVLTAKATDLLSGVKRIKLPNGNYVSKDIATYQVGENGDYVFEAEDNVGNKTTFEFNVNNIKKNVLITHQRLIELELNADDLYSGVTQMQFRNENGAWSALQPYSPKADWYVSPVDGLKHVWVRFLDKVGNVSAEIEDIVILDTTPPTISKFEINDGDIYTNTKNVTVKVKGQDTLSGLEDIYLSNDNKNWTKFEYTEEAIPWVLSDGDGNKTVYVKISDGAGNLSKVATDTIYLDTEKPLASILINNGDPYTPTRDVKLTLTYSDTGSGVDIVKVIEGDREYILPKPLPNSPVTIPWTLDFGVSRTVSIVVVDKAGNVSNIASDSIIVDKLTIKDFTLEDVVNPLEFNAKHPFTPKVWAFAPQPMLSGGNITFAINIKSAFEPEMVVDKVDYKLEVIGDNGYHKAFVGTMRKAGDHHSQTITIPKDAPKGAKVYVSATAERKLLIAPYDTQIVYFPGGEDSSQKAQIGVVGENIYDVIRFNETH